MPEMVLRSVRTGALAALVLLGACAGFRPASFPNTESLFRASMREFRAGRFARSQAGFQRLTLELSHRDTLMPQARFFLAESHFGQRDYVTASREFRRVADEHPTDQLAPMALLRSGDAHATVWRRPELDASSGQTALAVYQELIGRYPDTRAARMAGVRIAALNDEFAEKDFQSGIFYYRRGAYESAILYFRSLISSYPSARVVPEAFVRLVRAYRAIGYTEEEEETCAHLRLYYGGRADVVEVCGDRAVRR